MEIETGLQKSEAKSLVMHSYLTFDDETQIAYSEVREDQTVRIAIERPVELGFNCATCLLPQCHWSDVDGFTQKELDFLTDIVKNNAPLIYRLAREAGEGRRK